ncbi:Membrane-associated protein [Chitinispirillum alkaliphilum]|nr:Membrane-associated protein [Chitinispirillum alkaliphilum]
MSVLSNIGLFQPLYLWALSFLAVLLAIHFFRKRRLSFIEFSTLRFFDSTAVSTSRLKKLRKILLVVTRTLGVIAIILLFTGVHDRSNPLQILHNPSLTMYTWIDPSMSMEYRDEGFSVGQRGIVFTDSLLRVVPQAARHFHYDDMSGEFIYTRFFGQNDFKGRYGSSGIDEVIHAFSEVEKDHHSVLVLVSDFQELTMKEFESLAEKHLENRNVICVSVAPQNPFNYSVRVTGAEGSSGAVTFKLFADGKDLEEAQAVVVIDNMRAGEMIVSVNSGDSAEYTIEIPSDLNFRDGFVELLSEDPLPYDNRDFFTVSKLKNRSVLIVGDENRNRVISSAFRSLGEHEWYPVTMRSAGNITFQDIENSDLIVINSLSQRCRPVDMLLSGRSFPEKSIVLALDPEQDIAVMGSDVVEKIAPYISDLKDTEHQDGTHPVLSENVSQLWSGFPEKISRNTVINRKFVNLGGSPLLSSGNASPVFTFFTSESGRRWVLSSTPIGLSRSNNFFQTGFYIPMLDRISKFALSSDQINRDEVWYAGVPRRNPFFGEQSGAEIFSADELLISRWENQPVVAIDQPGIYKVVPDGEMHKSMAVHYPVDEFSVNYRFPGNVTGDALFYFETDAFFDQFLNRQNWLLNYGLWFIIIFLLLTEIFLWGFDRSEKRQTEKGN